MNDWEDHGTVAGCVEHAERKGAKERADRYRLHIGHKMRYSSRWDADACLDCDVWLEPKCNCDPNDTSLAGACPFPGSRPEKPSEVT